MYLQDIIDISSKYKGNLSYQYHKAFAMKIATIKLTRGLSLLGTKSYMQLCVVVILSMYAHIAVVAYMCSKYVESALRSNYVNNIQRVIHLLLVLTLTKVKASTQLIHMEDIHCFIRDARFLTIFLQDHA